jgi:hypothetical protein
MITSFTMAAVIAACGSPSAGSGDLTPPPDHAVIASVRLTRHAMAMDAGDEQPIELQGLTTAGGTVPLSSVQWTGSDELTLVVTGATASVRGFKGGRGWVVARSSGFVDSALVDVRPKALPTSRILLDMVQPLQRAANIDKAFALFGTIDHTPYRGARNTTGGWSFTTNADGKGLHALRADWSQSEADQGLRVIDYFPNPKPLELYVSWKGRLGKMAADPDANGENDSYAMWPQSNSCKRALFDRADDKNRVDFTLNRTQPEGAKLEMGEHDYARFGDIKLWNPNAAVGGAPFTTAVHVKAASSNTVADGVFQLWVDGNLVIDQRDVPSAANPFDRWSFPETCVLVPQPQSEYFWDILAWAP